MKRPYVAPAVFSFDEAGNYCPTWAKTIIARALVSPPVRRGWVERATRRALRVCACGRDDCHYCTPRFDLH